MAKEWTHQPGQPLAPRSASEKQLSGPYGTKLLGRLIIEAWEPSDPSSDGIAYSVESSDRTPEGADKFARELAVKFVARLQKHRWPNSP
jgi:hypothetical protein